MHFQTKERRCFGFVQFASVGEAQAVVDAVANGTLQVCGLGLLLNGFAHRDLIRIGGDVIAKEVKSQDIYL